jgi:GTP-binding protein
VKLTPDQLKAFHQRFRRASYINAAHEWRQLPTDRGREIAFAGRSNVGKSSVINRLCDQGRLARTSRTPGRTQQIVYFDLGPEQRLADLPGYGYAKVPQELKKHWGQLMDRYFTQRRSLHGLVIIMDIRHPLTEHDQHMLTWSQNGAMPCHVVLNKADKLSRGAALQTLQKVKRQLPPGSSVQMFSALKKQGIEELLNTLHPWLETPGEIEDDTLSEHD